MNEKGYVMAANAYLLIIPAILVAISFMNMVHGGNEINSQSIQSDKVLNAFEDLKRNIPIVTRDVLENTSAEIIENNKTVSNSTQTIKDEIQIRMNSLSENYENKTDLDIDYSIKSVQSYPLDPEYIEVNSTLSIEENGVGHQDYLSQLVSINGLADPLPFIKCRSYGPISHNKTHILYGTSLKEYLSNQNLENSTYYINATSPLTIKKCPYDPYTSHGSLNTLQNCLDNGYYHESADGSCYMCRLEGKGSCPHYGLETFIIPAPLNSSNYTSIKAPCSSDHVIFSDHYYGSIITYSVNNQCNYVLFLDNGHKLKYGII